MREGPERDLDCLLGFVRAKYDVGADRLALAQRMLMAKDIRELPQVLRRVDIGDPVTFLEEQARALVRRG